MTVACLWCRIMISNAPLPGEQSPVPHAAKGKKIEPARKNPSGSMLTYRVLRESRARQEERTAERIDCMLSRPHKSRNGIG